MEKKIAKAVKGFNGIYVLYVNIRKTALSIMYRLTFSKSILP